MQTQTYATTQITPTEQRLARRLITRTYTKLSRPTMILVAGLPGSGRNALARYIALKYRLAHLSFENLIHRFLQSGGDPHLLMRRAREAAYSVLGEELKHRHGIVFEGMLLTRRERDQFKQYVPEAAVTFTLITAAPDQWALHRLKQRNLKPYGGSNIKQHATPADYRRYRDKFELPHPDEYNATVVDTTQKNIDGQLTLLENHFCDNYTKLPT